MATNISSPSAETRGIIYKIFPKGKDFPKAMNEDQRRVRRNIKIFRENSTRFFLKAREKRIKERAVETTKLLPKEFLEKFRFKSKSELPSYVEECYGIGRQPYETCFMKEIETFLNVTGQTLDARYPPNFKRQIKVHKNGIKACKDYIYSLPRSKPEDKTNIEKEMSALGNIPIYISPECPRLFRITHFTYDGKKRSFKDYLTPTKAVNELDLKFHVRKGKITLKRWMQDRDVYRILDKVTFETVCKRINNVFLDEWIRPRIITEEFPLENEKEFIVNGFEQTDPMELHVKMGCIKRARWFTSEDFIKTGEEMFTWNFNKVGSRAVFDRLNDDILWMYWRNIVGRRDRVKKLQRMPTATFDGLVLYRIKLGKRSRKKQDRSSLLSDLRFAYRSKLKGKGKKEYSFTNRECRKWLKMFERAKKITKKWYIKYDESLDYLWISRKELIKLKSVFLRRKTKLTLEGLRDLVEGGFFA